MNLGVPTPRAAHAMCSVDRDLHIFGGRDTEKRQNDLHIFNVGKYLINLKLLNWSFLSLGLPQVSKLKSV